MSRREKTTSAKLARLMELNKQDQETIYERLKLAAEVLDDEGWLFEKFEGDMDLAYAYMQDTYFTVLKGTWELEMLVTVWRHFPDESVWKANKYNLQAMNAAYEEVHKRRREPRERTDWRKLCQELQAEIQRLKLENLELKLKLEQALHGTLEPAGAEA